MNRSIGCYWRSRHRISLQTVKFDVINYFAYMRTVYCLCKGSQKLGVMVMVAVSQCQLHQRHIIIIIIIFFSPPAQSRNLLLLLLSLLLLRTFIQRKFARATNALRRQRWQYGYVTVYVSIAIYKTNCQDS